MSKTFPPYNAVICAIARDEDPYIEEWTSYHLALGFDHIYIYDNMSQNSPEIFLRHQMFRGNVTVQQWPTRPLFSAQIDAYNDFLTRFRDVANWVAIIDLDEFINLKKHRSIGEFLTEFDDASGVSLNWRIFGSSGCLQYRDEPLSARFRWASHLDFAPNALRKGIHRLADTSRIDIHRAHYISPGAKVLSAAKSIVGNDDTININPADFDIAQINHYFGKSYEEWLKKLQRGYTDYTQRPTEIYAFYDRNDVLDDSISTFPCPRDCPQIERVIDYFRLVMKSSSTWPIMYFLPGQGRVTSPHGQLQDSCFHVKADEAAQLLLHGPYIRLPAGKYLGRIRFKDTTRGRAVIDVAVNCGHRVSAMSFDGDMIGEDGFVQLMWTLDEMTNDVEIRLFSEKPFEGVIRRVEISVCDE